MFISLNHIGFEVPDLQAARYFFVDALGFRLLDNEELRSDVYLARWHEIDSTTVSFLILEHSSGLRIGLAESQLEQPVHPGAGRYHLAMNVIDLKVALASLGEYPGVQIRSTSTNRTPQAACIITPWGMYIQLIEKQSPI